MDSTWHMFLTKVKGFDPANGLELTDRLAWQEEFVFAKRILLGKMDLNIQKGI
jgi:hypothetical protein